MFVYLKQILMKYPSLFRFAYHLKTAINNTIIKVFGLGYTSKQITNGPNSGLHFIAGKRVPYSKLFWNGKYEEATCHFLTQTVTPEEVCYDVGANLGYHSLIMAKKCSTGCVYAFEPIESVCEILATNAKINGITNIYIFPTVVTNNTGQVVLAREKTIDQAAIRFATEKSNLRNREKLICDGITLDDFVLQGHKPPTFIKIDVEGAETQVLLGSLEVIKRYRPKILCETHGVEAAHEVFRILTSLGYKLHNVTENYGAIMSEKEMPVSMYEGHVFAYHQS